MYKDLKTLFSIDENEWKNEYKKRYFSEYSQIIDFQINNDDAFFTQTPEIIQKCYSIFALDKKITALCASLPVVALTQYADKCLIDEIVISNNIEGVHSSRKEIKDALSLLKEKGLINKKHVRFIGLVNKYYKLLSSEPISLQTCEDIRSIYDEVVLEEVVQENTDNRPDGKLFRKGQASVIDTFGDELHRGIFPEEKIIECMKKALDFLNDDSVQKLYTVSIFHYLFEYIHPFYDGNGRLGRFILSYCLSQILHPLMAYRLSWTIEDNIRKYYNAFKTCNDVRNKGDLTPFLLMMLTMIENVQDELYRSLEEKKAMLAKYSGILNTLPNGGFKDAEKLYGFLLQASLFSRDGISTQELSDYMSISYGSLRSRLIFLERSDLLETKKTGGKKYYELNVSHLDSIKEENH